MCETAVYRAFSAPIKSAAIATIQIRQMTMMNTTATATAAGSRPRNTERRRTQTTAAPACSRRRGEDTEARLGIHAVAWRVDRVSAAAGRRGSAAHLLQYSRRTHWESFAHQRETLVLALDKKTLLSEIRMLNKNACSVDVSIAVEDRPRSYITVQRLQDLPHTHEVRIKIGFFPCCFVKLEFRRQSQSSVAVYGFQFLGVASEQIEADSGPSLCNLLSHTTENLLFGSSLRASLPYRDCLSDHVSGSAEWMERQRPYLLDERIARLEAALFS